MKVICPIVAIRTNYFHLYCTWAKSKRPHIKGELIYDRSHVAFIAQLGEHCTGIAEVVGSNPAHSLKISSGLCSSSVTAALALMTVIIICSMIGNRYTRLAT